MYNVLRQSHELYGEIILISLEETGSYLSPFQAANQARLLRRASLEKGIVKVRFLINNEILTLQELENWAKQEYEFLPKCCACGSILEIQVHTHPLCKSNLFCSQQCADMDYTSKNEKILDEVEIDYL